MTTLITALTNDPGNTGALLAAILVTACLVPITIIGLRLIRKGLAR